MRLVFLLHRLCLLAALLAIVIGPMSIGLAGSAMASSDTAMTDGMTSAMAGMKMAEDMPCCPEKQPVKPNCGKGCPLALICTTAIFAHAPESHGWSFAISWLSHRYDLMPATRIGVFKGSP